MKNIQEVLRAKEQQLAQIQREIEALRTAMRIMAEECEPVAARPTTSTNVPAPQMVMRPAPPVAPQVSAPAKETTSYVAASAWDVAKPQFP